MNLKLYSGKADMIVDLLDKIILQNDKLVNNRVKQECALKDGIDMNELGLARINARIEKEQQDLADEIAQIDKRGTVRILIAKDYSAFLEQDDASKDEQRLASNRLLTLGLVNVYRMRREKQTDVILKLVKELPTTDRDYTMFWQNWGKKIPDQPETIRKPKNFWQRWYHRIANCGNTLGA